MKQAKYIDAWRSEFVDKYPVPQYCYWNHDRQIYITAHIQQSAVCARYNREMGIWIESRQSAIITIPSNYSIDFTLINKIKSMIELQGYKVKLENKAGDL